VTDTASEFSIDTAAVLAAEEHDEEAIKGRSPWALVWRRLRRNHAALIALGIFVLIVVCCAMAPIYARDVAGTGPNATHIEETVQCGNTTKHVVSQSSTQAHFDPKTGEIVTGKIGSVPLGPQWFGCGGKYVLGADSLGRDVAVRLLYGGLTSLLIGFASAFLCVFFGVVFALFAGFHGGWFDWGVTRTFDIVYAYPVILLAIAIGTSLAISGFHHGPIDIQSGSLLIPIFVISLPLIPYVGRPLRGQILSLRQKEFVEAATAQGAGSWRIMFLEILPNIMSTVLVFFALTIANNIIFEAGLSFLGAGVQPPNPSWGTLIADGGQSIVTAPWLALVPGIAIVLTVLSLNIFGDGLRDALDPRAKVKMEH
jgi:peptide/nickel transport system permease protein